MILRASLPGAEAPGYMPAPHPGLAYFPDSSSDRYERFVRLRRELDPDRIPGPHLAAVEDDPHDAGLADEIPLRVPPQDRRHQAGLKVVQLDARIAQAGHLDHRRLAQVQPRTGRQPEQIEAAGGDVLPHRPGRDVEAGRPHFGLVLHVDDAYLLL